MKALYSALVLFLLAAHAAAVTVSISCPAAAYATINPGSTQTFKAYLVASANVVNATVSFEIYNSAGTKVYQTYKMVNLKAAVSVTVTGTWAIPANQPLDRYSVKVLSFGPKWIPLYSTKSSCVIFNVVAKTTSASTTTAAPTTKPPTTAAPTTAAPTTTVAPTTAPSSPSGVPLPKGDLPGWTQLVAEDFNTPAAIGSFLSTYPSWGAYPDGWTDTSKNGRYYPSKTLAASGGMMSIYLHTENGTHLVCAPYPRIPGANSHNGML